MSKVLRYGAVAVGVALFSSCCFVSGFLAGGLSRERAMQRQQYLDEQRAVAPLLKTDPAYARVAAVELSRGGISLQGSVPADEDLRRLHGEVINLFGRKRADDMVRPIEIECRAAPP
jgi:hypothetical protein